MNSFTITFRISTSSVAQSFQRFRPGGAAKLIDRRLQVTNSRFGWRLESATSGATGRLGLSGVVRESYLFCALIECLKSELDGSRQLELLAGRPGVLKALA
jgi:hypothetical protein